MTTRTHVSLRHEYEQYVEQEIENYKFSLPRAMILRIGDEAVAFLRQQEQPEFNELVIWAEVDEIIRRRLRLFQRTCSRATLCCRDRWPRFP